MSASSTLEKLCKPSCPQCLYLYVVKKKKSGLIGLLQRLNETTYLAFLNTFLGHTKCLIIWLIFFSFLPQSALLPLSSCTLPGVRELFYSRDRRVHMSKIRFEALAYNTTSHCQGNNFLVWQETLLRVISSLFMKYVLVKQGLDVLERESFSEKNRDYISLYILASMKLRGKGFAKFVPCLDTCSEPECSWQLLQHAPPCPGWDLPDGVN